MEESGERLFRLALAIVAAVTAVRVAVLIASPLQLYPDEAQYWWWAQTPDLGYFSKPPLIAWIIRATTSVFGDREWAIRFAIPFFHAGASLLLFAIARETFPRLPQIAFWSALAYLTLPGVSYSSGLASTDAPLLFFWTLALFALLRARDRSWRWSLLCGAAIGFGVLAKYAMLFFIPSAILAGIVSAPLRRAFFGWRGLAALLVAAIVIAPNLAWNASHNFSTVAHTQANADWSRAHFSPLHLISFVAGQFGVFGPVLMAAWLAGLWRVARDTQRSSEEMVLYAMSAPTLALIAVQSFISEAHANWAATAYVAAVPLAISQILKYWPRIVLWASFAMHGIVLVLLWVFVLWPATAERLGAGNVFKREEGWRELADGVRAQAVRGGFSVVATDNRSVTAELLYYMSYISPGGPGVRIWDPGTASHNHFEMTMRLAPSTPRVLLVVTPEDAPQVTATFESTRLIETLSSPVGGRQLRSMNLYDAREYRGPRIRD